MNRHPSLGSLTRLALLPSAAYAPAPGAGYGSLPLRVL